MSPMRWFLVRGRIRRRTWWLYVLVVLALSVLAAAADTALGYPGLDLEVEPETFVGFFGGPVSLALTVATLAPVVSSSVARLHDCSRSAWYLLWLLVPIVGWIALLTQNGCLSGDEVPNRYGSPPPGRLAPPLHRPPVGAA